MKHPLNKKKQRAKEKKMIKNNSLEKKAHITEIKKLLTSVIIKVYKIFQK